MCADAIDVRSILALLGVGLMAALGASPAAAALTPGDLVVADAQAFGEGVETGAPLHTSWASRHFKISAARLGHGY